MPHLLYFQHRDGGAIHGFTLPLLPDIEAQVRTGALVPVDTPPVPQTLELPAGMAEEALAEERRLRKAKRRRELEAELAELSDVEDDDEEEDDVPEVPRHAAAAPTREVDEPFGPVDPAPTADVIKTPAPELPKADGLSGAGPRTTRGGRRP